MRRHAVAVGFELPDHRNDSLSVSGAGDERNNSAECTSAARLCPALAGGYRHAAHAPLWLRRAMVRARGGGCCGISDCQYEAYTMKQQNRARLKLLATFMLFLGPLALAYILYYGMHGAIAGKATNNGQLLTPAKPLPEITLRGRDGGTTSGDVFGGQWTFLQVAPEGCGGAC